MSVSLLRRGVSPGIGPVGALGELRWLHLYRLTPDLIGILLFAGCLGCSGRCFLFTVRHSARIHGDHLVSFTDSCVSVARHPHKGVVPWTPALRVTGWLYCPPPHSSRTLSFALASGRDSTVLIPPAKDSGESPSFTVGLTPCYCGVLGGLPILVGSLTSPSLGRLFEPSYLGRVLCLRLG